MALIKFENIYKNEKSSKRIERIAYYSSWFIFFKYFEDYDKYTPQYCKGVCISLIQYCLPNLLVLFLYTFSKCLTETKN